MNCRNIGRKDLKIGDSVQIIASARQVSPGHLGSFSKIKNAATPYQDTVTYLLENGITYCAESLLFIPKTINRVEVVSDLEEQQAIVDDLKTKLAFLDEIESDEADIKEFKVFSTLTLIDNTKMTKRQKAKAIAALLTED